MKIVLLLLTIILSNTIFSQIPEIKKFLSPKYIPSKSTWGYVKVLPTTYWRYFADSASVTVYDGPYNISNVKYVVSILPDDIDDATPTSNGHYPSVQIIKDITGDGINDIKIGPYRLINGVNGSTCYNFRVPNSYYYFSIYVDDFDGDGKNEIFCTRRYSVSSDESEVIVYETKGVTSAVNYQESYFPNGFELKQNFPNPFNPTTMLRYNVPERSNVRLSIFNTLGQQISQVVNGTKDAGHYEQAFNASQLSSGIYFYRIEATSTQNSAMTFVETKKMVLMR
jgi:hypothetical protein